MEQKDGEAPFGLTRRGFCASFAGAAALFAFGGVAAAAPVRPLVRPPGAQDEQALLGACIRCDRCRSICPENAISLATIEDGLVVARTPKMTFRQGFCTTCEGEYRCAAVCPTGAIRTGFDMRAQAIGTAMVDEEECLLFRGSSSMCSKQCIEACPYDALRYTEPDGLEVDASRCNGCGACELACPSASYGGSTASKRRGINIERGQS